MIVSNTTLGLMKSKGISVPSYDRASLKPAYVHIGLGCFHRSHFLTYMNRLLNAGIEKYGVFEVDTMPTSQTFIEGLKKQDYLYSLLTLGPDGSRNLEINGPIVGYANQINEPEKVHEMLSSPMTRLITLTITEKGYCYLDDQESLDWENPMIVHDLHTEEAPMSAIGCIAKALKTRFKMQSPVTIMSCDNVPENGSMLKLCILQFCERKYPDICSWVSTEVAFPSTMVDRITPGTHAQDIENLEKRYALEDCCPVHCEEFSQWVIEDWKCTEIPDFAQVGALVVEDVKPYELMKIRLLNGSHSALSYPAYMMGHKMVHEAIDDPLIGKFIRKCYMEQVAMTLFPVPGIDLEAYKDELISRFSNPHIADTILRLASDGSKKISNAIMRPLEEGLSVGENVDALILSLALWQYSYMFKDKQGTPMPIDDPKKEVLLKKAGNSSSFLREAGLSESACGNVDLIGKMERFLCMLKTTGVKETLATLTS